MSRTSQIILVFAILFLFVFQAAGTLVESIYILNLLQTALNAKASGVLFFFAPVLLIPLYQTRSRWLIRALFVIVFFTRGILPYVNTSNRMLAAGFATFAALSLIFLLLVMTGEESRRQIGIWAAAGLGLAVSLSVLLYTAGLGIEASLTPSGGWAGWVLGILLGGLLLPLNISDGASIRAKGRGSVTTGVTGLYLILTLLWFAFTAPGVIARWTEGNYTLIVIGVSTLSAGWVGVSVFRPGWIDRISRRSILLWNLLFTLSLTATLLAQRVSFPLDPESAPVIVSTPGALTYLPLILVLLLFPVIYLDFSIFLQEIERKTASPRDLIPGILWGGLIMIAMVFIQIFTNVWGYVQPVSLPFRNKFWLPYFLLAGGITLLVALTRRQGAARKPEPQGTIQGGWAILLGGIILVTAVRAFPARPGPAPEGDPGSLVVMTFNTQQFNDNEGEKAFDRQLALIQAVSPDILALQENDSTRISLNNNDYVRYFAEELGYYTYYGPTTVAGTYGTAILSRVPLLNPRTIFTYSDKDEIGISVAEIEVSGHRITLYNVHPDGSDRAMLAFARALLENSRDDPYVIAAGDYNLRDYEEAYQIIDQVLVNAWTSVYPAKISPEGVDMSGENRIDHIFLSPNLAARNPVYVLPPDSATDHPVHWAEITWTGP